MSPEPANTLTCAMHTTWVFGQFASLTRGSYAVHEMVPSETDVPIVSGHTGSTVPDFRIGWASYTTRERLTASQMTSWSITCWPSTPGHVGSTVSLYPVAG